MLNGKELLELKVITGEIPTENIQQHGIDLNVVKINKIKGMGRIPLLGKTEIASYEEVPQNSGVWVLEPGAYDVTMKQGCDIPSNMMLLIRQRSSLLRNGAILHSSVFDAGFKTDQIGTVMILQNPLIIEVGARIAQAYAHNCTEVENLYDGQFQNDKQRKDV